MTQNKPAKQTIAPTLSLSITQSQPEDERAKQWPRFLRFFNALKTETSTTSNMMSWKVEGKEWVES